MEYGDYIIDVLPPNKYFDTNYHVKVYKKDDAAELYHKNKCASSYQAQQIGKAFCDGIYYVMNKDK